MDVPIDWLIWLLIKAVGLYLKLAPVAQVIVVLMLMAVVIVLAVTAIEIWKSRRSWRARYKSKCQEDEATSREYQAKVEELQTTCSAYRTTREDYKSKWTGLQIQHKEMEAKRDDYRAACETLEAKCQEHEGVIEKTEAEYTECQAKCRALVTECKGYERLRKAIEEADSCAWQEHRPHSPPEFLQDRKCVFVAVLNLKGGVGKTMLTANLGAGFAASITGRAYKVLLVDLDYQGSLSNRVVQNRALLDDRRRHHQTSTRLIGEDAQQLAPESVLDELIIPVGENGDLGQIVVAERSLYYADFRQQAQFVAKGDEVRFHYRKIFHSPAVCHRYDLVLFDCPPRLTTSAVNALACSDFVVIPTGLSSDDVEAVRVTIDTFEEIKQVNPSLKLAGVVVNQTHRAGSVEDLTKGKGGESSVFEELKILLRQCNVPEERIFRNVVRREPRNIRQTRKPFAASEEGRKFFLGLAQEISERITRT